MPGFAPRYFGSASNSRMVSRVLLKRMSLMSLSLKGHSELSSWAMVKTRW